MRTNTAATLYNVYYNIATKANLYKRTVLPAVEWENRKASNVLRTGGNIAADIASIFIPITPSVDYLAPKAWLALVDKSGNFTLQEGDILVKGEVADELSAAFLPTALKAKYDDVLTISSVDTFDFGSASLHHWKVGVK